MDSSLVKIDNVIGWDGVKSPFVEDYSLFLHDEKGKWSLVLRFFFDIQPAPKKKRGSVQALFQSLDGEQVEISKSFDLDKYDVVHADKFIQMGDCSLSLADCVGSLQSKDQVIKWECLFEDPVLSYRPLPDVFYPFSFPRFKMFYPRFLTFARGQFFVNHKKYEFGRMRVCQVHSFGKALPKHFFQAHCLEFEQDSDSVFSIYAPTLAPQGPLMPYVIFAMEGQVFQTRSLIWPGFGTHLKSQPPSPHLQFSKQGFRFDVEFDLNPDFDFDLGSGTTLNLLGDLKIKIAKKGQKGFQDYKVLTSKRKAHVIHRLAQKS